MQQIQQVANAQFTAQIVQSRAFRHKKCFVVILLVLLNKFFEKVNTTIQGGKDAIFVVAVHGV